MASEACPVCCLILNVETPARVVLFCAAIRPVNRDGHERKCRRGRAYGLDRADGPLDQAEGFVAPDRGGRPVYHWLPERVRAHVFLCMLGYYLEWHMAGAREEVRSVPFRNFTISRPLARPLGANPSAGRRSPRGS